MRRRHPTSRGSRTRRRRSRPRRVRADRRTRRIGTIRVAEFLARMAPAVDAAPAAVAGAARPALPSSAARREAGGPARPSRRRAAGTCVPDHAHARRRLHTDSTARARARDAQRATRSPPALRVADGRLAARPALALGARRSSHRCAERDDYDRAVSDDLDSSDFTAEATLVPRRQRRAARSRRSSSGARAPTRSAILEEKTPERGGRRARRGQGVEGHGVRRRLRLDHRPRGVRRARAAGGVRARVPRGAGRLRDPDAERVRHRARHGRADDPRPRDPRGARALPALAVPRRHRRAASSSPSRSPAPTSPGSRPAPMRDGDEWVVTGQKVWTSGAQYSDIGEIITRTSPDKPKHKGLTMFVVDMHAPGVEVRPLRQMTGGASFNEVFFDEVRVPDSHRLGDVDEGWTVALTTLMNERAAIGGGGARRRHDELHPLRRAWRTTSASPTTRSSASSLADVYVAPTVAQLHEPAGDGEDPRRPAARARRCRSAKLSLTAEHAAHRATCSATMLGPRLVADTGEWGTYAWARVRARHPRHAHRRRHRRDHAQHRRRARARPAQGAPAREVGAGLRGHGGGDRAALVAYFT